MPWAISITFHIGLLLTMTFFTWLVVENTWRGDRLISPTSSFTDEPGAPLLDKKQDESVSKSKRNPIDLHTPAPEVPEKRKGQPIPDALIAVPGPVGRGDDKGDLGELFGGQDKGGGDFFGIRPGADRIVYVLDKSGSMFQTFDYVRAELIRSVGDLHIRQQFTAICFADGRPHELLIDGGFGLAHANSKAKRTVVEWINRQIPGSSGPRGTDPRQALERAFKAPGGPPELIYLLTDGQFPRETLDLLDRLNKDRKVRINTIAFKDRVGEELLQEIARRHGGRYKFISEDQLGTEY